MIPEYRAKKIDSDEWVEGSLLANAFYKRETNTPCCYIFNTDVERNYDCMDDLGYVFEENEVDPNTLAIHFPNMIDKNGKKIFASLSEDGVGGDNLKWGDMDMTAKYSEEDGAFILSGHSGAGFMNPEYCKNFEVVGIHKGES